MQVNAGWLSVPNLCARIEFAVPWLRNRFGRANPASNEMMMKELHSELGVIADLSALEMRASATAKVTTKGIKQDEIDVLQRTPSPLNEAAEMRRGSDVSN